MEPKMRLAIFIFVLFGSSLRAQRDAKKEWEEQTSRVEQLYQQGKYDEALDLARRALDLAEKEFGLDHSNTAESLNNVAVLYKSKGDYASAEPLYRRALAIREKKLGPDHPDTAASVNNLASLYYSKGDY